jgi:hypothetical protein
MTRERLDEIKAADHRNAAISFEFWEKALSDLKAHAEATIDKPEISYRFINGEDHSILTVYSNGNPVAQLSKQIQPTIPCDLQSGIPSRGEIAVLVFHDCVKDVLNSARQFAIDPRNNQPTDGQVAAQMAVDFADALLAQLKKEEK